MAVQDLHTDIALAVQANCPPGYVVTTDRSPKAATGDHPVPEVLAARVESDGRSSASAKEVVLAVDVLSSRLRWRDLVDRTRRCAGMGIATYWVIDSSGDEVSLMKLVLGSDRVSYLLNGVTTDVVTVAEPWSIIIDLPALSARRTDRAVLEPHDGLG